MEEAKLMVGGLSRPALRILHVDDHLLVIDKPAGVLCVPGRGPDKQACLAADAQALYPDALVVHRLDMATSGVWLMARGAAAQTHLSKAFAARRVVKRYVAIVAGVAGVADVVEDAPAEWREIDLPLARDWPNRPRSKVDHAVGKLSVTRWRVLGPGPHAGTMRLELEPMTGRTHQLRVHLAAIGHPILGDALYAPPTALAAASRLLLHASELQLPHPADGTLVAWHSVVPF
jgi:tRNA pseudouridine32 synthase/23S rRNA pseudouridine746 synthase